MSRFTVGSGCRVTKFQGMPNLDAQSNAHDIGLSERGLTEYASPRL
jgi:hypothetical protein